MSDTNTVGPAFPVSYEYAGTMVAEPGMTLRDYFAAKAMQSFAINAVGWNDHIVFEDVAEGAYRLADAMLKAREQ